MKRLFLSVLLCASGALAGEQRILFLTDFGLKDDSVAICKSVMLAIEPAAQILDITHDSEPYNILEGARFLAGMTPYHPRGTVLVGVVDPGVGSERKALVAKTKLGHFVVVPDNGLLTLIEQQDGLEAVHAIVNRTWLREGALSATFHGRDVFAPVAAHLARGEWDWKEVGPKVTDWVRLPVSPAKLTEAGLEAKVIAIEKPYGNLVTNASQKDFAALGWELGDNVPVKLAGKKSLTVPFARTFSDVKKGQPLLYIDSRGRVGFAVNEGDFAKVHGVVPPAALSIPKAP